MSEVIVPDEIEALATTVVNAAFSVHRNLGPGLLESAYQECLAIELSLAGCSLQRELVLPLRYRHRVVPNAFRVDMIVNDQLLLELKALDSVQPIHRDQATTYLRLLKLPLGSRVLNLDFRTPPSAAAPRDERSPAVARLASSRLRA